MGTSDCGEYFRNQFKERNFYGIFPCKNLVVPGPLIIILHGYRGSAKNKLQLHGPRLQLHGFAGFALEGYEKSWNGIDCCGSICYRAFSRLWVFYVQGVHSNCRSFAFGNLSSQVDDIYVNQTCFCEQVRPRPGICFAESRKISKVEKNKT